MNILITGAASGIGLEIVKKINRNNHIYLTVHNRKEILRVKRILKDYNNVEIFKLDVTNKEDRKILDTLDIDIFISNAAVGEGGSIIDIDFDRVRYNHEVNVFSNFEIIQIILKKMLKKDSGKIIIVSSILSQFIFPFLGSYASSKASISSLGLTLRKEVKLLTDNIHISVVEPGCYHTGFNQVMLRNKYDYMDENSLFYKSREKIYIKEGLFFKIFERKSLRTVSNKIIDIIYNTNPKALYRVPLDQGLFTKIYMLFKR